jgi:hypothetical protein
VLCVSRNRKIISDFMQCDFCSMRSFAALGFKLRAPFGYEKSQNASGNYIHISVLISIKMITSLKIQ